MPVRGRGERTRIRLGTHLREIDLRLKAIKKEIFRKRPSRGYSSSRLNQAHRIRKIRARVAGAEDLKENFRERMRRE